MNVSEDLPFVCHEFISADEFLLEMLKLGKPIEVSLVGAFDTSGRGSRRDIELPMHQDGDYSIEHKEKIDIVGLYCVKPGPAKTMVEVSGEVREMVLRKGEGLVFDNRACRHGRKGEVGNRILLRVWIQRSGS